jgi:hypothetical protein
MEYEVHGPYVVPRKVRLIDRNSKVRARFWSQIDAEIPGLSEAVGCYIFCVNNKPWYVGMAERQTFRKECFGHHKLVAYNEALVRTKKGVPKLYLLAKLTKGGAFTRVTTKKHRSTHFLENLLIGIALNKNPELINLKNTKIHKSLIVPGVVHTPHSKINWTSVRALRTVLGT